MKKYQIDNNTIWEDTGKIKIHNYPPSKLTYSYVTRTYKEYKLDRIGYAKEVDGNPLYFQDMTSEQISLAIIMATAEKALNNICQFDKSLTPYKNI